MAIPTLRTWSAGDMATADMLNANIGDAVAFLINPPAAMIGLGSDTAIAASTWTKLGWTDPLLDGDDMHNSLSNNSRLTAQTAGWYSIQVCLRWASTSTNDDDSGGAATSRAAQIRLNANGSATGGTRLADIGGGSSMGSNPTGTNTDGLTATNETTSQVSCWKFLDVDDYIEVFARQNRSSALNLLGGDDESWISARWFAST